MNTRSAVRLALTFALFAGTATTLSACNTVAGAGKDVSSVGHDLSHGANYTQDKWHQAMPQAATH
ncbi:entericidin A/B family lipoprotein [Acidomonas methanolica]|uniref:Entericidin EcnAB n=1 Tax=Acidomonas methanolica NBRC 104435 TaxID=1231351 RepID=A0A023D3J6_ACIMT|nr:entericidin A/B family lipoprotein [Acidomonas methanolica]MBU2654836.1 entericidin A/B family lipoprotein [Acidomonas methanolica]MCQ9156209.1 entericidin A/B family lipoprotein [Acidomonas methanolica]TCS26500.1 putative small secreted protein [Acidomonas methanolica]GAJ28659.1 hypothetical protein Amme_033_003 [Acidomonas methanolica NBRC 104435]GBQ52111.1 hypothetical protein AA0498_1656 [Acidomonas methanolica]